MQRLHGHLATSSALLVTFESSRTAWVLPKSTSIGLPPAAEVAQAVRESESPDSPYLKPLSSSSPATSALGFFVPPPFAIAHHLMRAWVQHGGPWFSASGEVLQAQQQPQAPVAAPVASL